MAYLELQTTVDLDTFELAREISDNLLTGEIEDFIVDLVEQEESEEMARSLLRFLNDYLEENS